MLYLLIIRRSIPIEIPVYSEDENSECPQQIVILDNTMIVFSLHQPFSLAEQTQYMPTHPDFI